MVSVPVPGGRLVPGSVRDDTVSTDGPGAGHGIAERLPDGQGVVFADAG
jgi:hypothetical protein